MKEIRIQIQKRKLPYSIPHYSLTGDLLAFLRCGLQYRYYNRGSLPPSRPVQFWFGEFMHGVMDEAYLRWKHDGQAKRFPWDWKSEIRPIELTVNKRLETRQITTSSDVFCPYPSDFKEKGRCEDEKHSEHKRIASKRAEEAINTWGKHLFPLIEEASVRLKGIREMPKNYKYRCDYYGLTGVADVISSVKLESTQSAELSENLVLKYLHENRKIREIIDTLGSKEYEVIVDYKAMKRPSKDNPLWSHHEWQILTYAWLRSQQPQSKPVVAGILFYLNELVPSVDEIEELKEEIINGRTDILPQHLDRERILSWEKGEDGKPPLLSQHFREQRSIRIIPVTEDEISRALKEFDNVVGEIENCVKEEMCGKSIPEVWKPPERERRDEKTCTACDFKTFCPQPARKYFPTPP
ncbi:MAG: PD-(D/E)XK nuclease family protein [Candidatus Hadarchaeales archaeon]